MSEPLVIHVVNAASSRGDLWAEVQRQNALIHELREAVHAHAQTIRDKQAVIDAMNGRGAPTKSPEDRVKVSHAAGLAVVRLDHEFQVQFGNENPAERERNAEVYRLGLIATLKQGQQ